jgi:hypothetical protein
MSHKIPVQLTEGQMQNQEVKNERLIRFPCSRQLAKAESGSLCRMSHNIPVQSTEGKK